MYLLAERATALTSLSLQAELETLLSRWRLPFLRELTLSRTGLRFIPRALELFPALRSLTLILPLEDANYAFEEVAAALAHADQRGMELVDVQGCTDARLVGLCRELRWLTLRVTPTLSQHAALV